MQIQAKLTKQEIQEIIKNAVLEKYKDFDVSEIGFFTQHGDLTYCNVYLKEKSKTTEKEIPEGYTYDSKGNILTFKDSYGNWCECTRDSFGNVLTFKDSDGYWYEYTYDSFGNELTYKTSDGYWCEYTRDSKGNILTCKDSDGDNKVYSY